MRNRNLLLSIPVSLACIVPAVAQTTASVTAAPKSQADGAENLAGDIIVTAQKREQRVNDIGATITALSSGELHSSGVTQVTDLAKVASGVDIGATYSGYPIFSIRGVNFNASQFSAQPAVSVYLDEASLPYGAMATNVLLDSERVEVLKGPQGTLFGQNATGGSINVIANKPTSVLAFGGQLDVNHFGRTTVEGYISGPLSSTLRARVAATTTQFGAWQRGYYLSNRKNGDQDILAGRIMFDWTPNNALKVTLTLNANRDHSDSQALQISTINIQNPAGVFPPALLTYKLPDDNRDADLPPGFQPRIRAFNKQAMLRIDYDLSPEIRLTSLSEYIDSRYENITETSAIAFDTLQYDDLGTGKTFNQEVRLTGKTADGRLNYIIGANYAHDRLSDSTPFQKLIAYSAVPPGTILTYSYNIKNDTIGAFANADYKILDTLTLTGGVRYTDVKQSTYGCGSGNAAAAGLFGFLASLASGNPAVAAAYRANECLTIDDKGPSASYLPTISDLSQHEHNVSFRGGLTYQPNAHQLYYVLASRGYKAGLFPAIPTLFASQIDAVKQEELTSYEAGAKIDIVPGALHLNASVFHYDYNNKQFLTYIRIFNFGPALSIVNVPKSRENGVDVELIARPVDALTLRGALTYVDTKVGAYTGINFRGDLVNYQGKEFSYAPPFSATLDAQYMFYNDGKISAYVGGNMLHQDRTFSDLGEDPVTRLPARTLFDARIGLESTNGWRASLWVRNLTDTYYWNSIGPGGDVTSRRSGMPRTFGVTLGYKR